MTLVSQKRLTIVHGFRPEIVLVSFFLHILYSSLEGAIILYEAKTCAILVLEVLV